MFFHSSLYLLITESSQFHKPTTKKDIKNILILLNFNLHDYLSDGHSFFFFNFFLRFFFMYSLQPQNWGVEDKFLSSSIVSFFFLDSLYLFCQRAVSKVS